MIDVSFAYAFTVGMVVVVNPCGFPMLPAYLSYFTSLDDDVDAAGDWTARLGRGIRSGLAVAAGFLTVFGVLAVPINAGITEIYEVMPWLTIVIGVALAALGVLMLAGRKPVIVLPRLDRGGRTKGTGSMVLYGVSYAVASLGCSLPVMVALVSGTTQRSNLASGLLWFASYAAGATSVLVAVSVALALARGSLVRLLRASLRHVDRASGVLLVLVGAYLVWYGVFAAGSASSAITPFDWVEDQSASWTVRLQEGGADLGLALVAGVLLVAVVAAISRARRRS